MNFLITISLFTTAFIPQAITEIMPPAFPDDEDEDSIEENDDDDDDDDNNDEEDQELSSRNFKQSHYKFSKL